MKTKILLIVEGEAEEVRILGNHTYGLLKLINSDYEIVPFNDNPIVLILDTNKEVELIINDKIMIGETYKFNYLENCKIAEVVEKL